MASADATQTARGGPLLARWQGLIAPDQAVLKRLERLAGLLLLVLLTGLPLFTRTGLALVIAACGALWLLWPHAIVIVEEKISIAHAPYIICTTVRQTLYDIYYTHTHTRRYIDKETKILASAHRYSHTHTHIHT